MTTTTADTNTDLIVLGRPTLIKGSRSVKEANAIDAMLLRLRSFQNDRQLESLCVGLTSCEARSGVSTLASSSALRASLLGMGKVLLVDSDMLHPVAHRNFGLTREPGLADFLSNGGDITDFIQKSKDRDLDVLTAGSSEFEDIGFATNALQSLFAELRTRYQTIFVDIPSFDAVGNSFFMATQVDGLLMVLDPRLTRERESQHFIEFLAENKVEVIGGIMNRYQAVLPKWIRRWV